MWIPKEIGRMATRLKEGHRVNRITVRELLRMFRAERRGLNKVHDIRAALDSLGLVIRNSPAPKKVLSPQLSCHLKKRGSFLLSVKRRRLPPRNYFFLRYLGCGGQSVFPNFLSILSFRHSGQRHAWASFGIGM